MARIQVADLQEEVVLGNDKLRSMKGGATKAVAAKAAAEKAAAAKAAAAKKAAEAKAATAKAAAARKAAEAKAAAARAAAARKAAATRAAAARAAAARKAAAARAAAARKAAAARAAAAKKAADAKAVAARAAAAKKAADDKAAAEKAAVAKKAADEKAAAEKAAVAKKAADEKAAAEKAAVARKAADEKAAADKVAAAAKETGGSQTDHGANTNQPNLNNPNAHDHQTDGIHDDNGRLGNNGLGPKDKEQNLKATVVLGSEPKAAIPTGQVVGSSMSFYETSTCATKIDGANVSIDVVKQVNLSAGEDSSIRDAFTFKRQSGAGGFGVEVDTRIERAQVTPNAGLDKYFGKDSWINIGSTSVTYLDENGKTTFTEWRDPLALDLNGDGHISMTGVGRIEAGQHGVQWERMQKGVIMDFDNDGNRREAVSFATGKDAYLAIDHDGDGMITKGSELFGPTTNNGLQELSALDSNKDGLINKLDTDFGKLRLVSVEVRTQNLFDRASGGSKADKNFQMIGIGNVAGAARTQEMGYVQKLWSLDTEGISEISLKTLSKNAPAAGADSLDGSGLTSNQLAALKSGILDQAILSTGSSDAARQGATVSITADQGGKIAAAASVGQAFQAAQAGFGANLVGADQQLKKNA